MYSNCLFEALKAKIKDPKNVRIIRLPKEINHGYSHYMWIKDGFVYHSFDKNYDGESRPKLLFSCTNKKISFRRCVMLFISITLHNIPEGLVLGVAFGVASYGGNSTSFVSVLALTLGIAIQNFPEGSAISLPMRRENITCWKAFLFGSLSAIVEPIFAVIGALLVLKIQILLPFILSFTAGAMIFVIILELIPESQTNQKKGLMALFNMLGFSIMMILELLLG
mgnify:CR=1 FL=1